MATSKRGKEKAEVHTPQSTDCEIAGLNIKRAEGKALLTSPK